MTEIKPTLTLEGARTNLHMSQEDVAKALGISAKTYIEYEKYRRVMRTDRAYAFSLLVKQPLQSIIFLPSDYESFVDNSTKEV
ncbi:helix-turn-helix transcriptional regulator [Lacticaseibacillus pabuli]|uniref:Helix-turn-helix transcriptional regulator n=1 Tax=Lacticaseibacillus pabuli TaxID=3025672 RepID=A0ABY7WS59_9LACO|nr:helix-turn-helix transcriptional regulator [Lacticaseibacillus sp. KACC 23028]WDF81864.1 helix-turn-helix transcriptional regulator [Lacticaseibacillus sp. KACC 23028]